MPRPQKHRTICALPNKRAFGPLGISKKDLPTTILLTDEFESIRLLDYEGLAQLEASARMNISRPTLTRIYQKARKKVADALVSGHILVIEGGNFKIDTTLIICPRCNMTKLNNDKNTPICHKCNSAK